MDMMTTIMIMSEGDRHTHKLLRVCVDVDPYLLLHLDDMNLRGVQIWNAFYFYCDGLFEKFKVCVTTRDLDMINFVNKYPGYERAVPRGGAPR